MTLMLKQSKLPVHIAGQLQLAAAAGSKLGSGLHWVERCHLKILNIKFLNI